MRMSDALGLGETASHVCPATHEARGVGVCDLTARCDLTTYAHDAPQLALSIREGANDR